MLRWLLLPLGLFVAGAAGWLLLAAGGPPDPAARPRAPAVASPPAAATRPEPVDDAPMGEIDDASRRALERVLVDEGPDR